MKKIHLINLAALCCLAILLYSCEEDNMEDPKNNKQPIQFGLSPLDLSENGRIANIDDIMAIVITVKNESGEMIYQKKTIELYDVKGEFISAPVLFSPGNYSLIEFNVVDKDGNILYYAPHKDADRGHLVRFPLPLSFTIDEGIVKHQYVEVLTA